MPDLFFKSRGRNLLLAVLIAATFWWMLRFSYRRLTSTSWLFKPDRTGLRRTANVIYLVLSATGAVIVFLLALFFLGDWVLVILSVMVILGLVWTSKQALPQFWAQGALLLNIGPVREGERVEYLNLPWRVKSINLYSTLSNPLLSPSLIRLPLSDLLTLRSRLSGRDEPWFPTKVGDWILLESGQLAEVTHQSPSIVEVRMVGGVLKVFSVEVFLSESFVNLSEGFRLKSIFGLDYALQSNITTSALEILKNEMFVALESYLPPDSFSLSVEFQEAASSSLNIAILVDCSGECARLYDRLGRFVQAACVDIANKHGWTIPFTQVTLHMANPLGVNEEPVKIAND